MNQNPNYSLLQQFASIPGMQEMLRKQMEFSAGAKALPNGGFLDAAHAAQRSTAQYPSNFYQMSPDSNFDQWYDLSKRIDPVAAKETERRLLLEALTSKLMPSVAEQAYERKWNPPLQ